MSIHQDQLTTARDIRLSLASLLSQLEHIQNSESWATITSEHPTLTENFHSAHTAIDDLWFRFRCATTNPGD